MKKYSVEWANEKKKTCKLCQRKEGVAWCKRHRPRMTVERWQYKQVGLGITSEALLEYIKRGELFIKIKLD